ncbi:hypothetical protein DOTSEDRAFT_67650 [Dothistroma septosporum NZE10]|uniref:Hydrophobin n=1 Tax=Dothistroma septosporum (strain NZE10 / CBS 128990) TaxID=675120 RepID=N1Q220_DOTSN|nr:hypothetical protein DOTSEDRAFT_67650 [Dothistroma septosporum NZE10]
MQFTTLFAAALSACLVAAIPSPSYLPEGGDGSMDSFCGNQQKAACCDGSNEGGLGGIFGGILGGVLGGDCALTVVSGECSQGSVACCPTTNVGSSSLVSLGSICAPITL